MAKFAVGSSFYSQLCRSCGELARYDFVHLGSAGSTAGGREIPYIKLGGDDCVLFLAGTHPLEYITVTVLVGWLQKLCKSIETGRQFCGFDVRSAFRKKGVVAVPCHNPDGTEITFGNGVLSPLDRSALAEICGGDPAIFNCNLNGVDLNHNFDAGWTELRRLEKESGIDGPSPRRFGGPFPESEPETRAIVNLCHEFNPRQAIALHSQGEEIYWRYGDSLPKHAEVMAHILAISCNYTLAEPEGIASHGGFKDWFIREFNRPAFTFEIGKGKNPLPVTDTPALLKRLSDTLLIAALM